MGNNIAPPVVLLMGPTAVGKTDIAVRLAGQANMEIISVDSALVYQGMDIGTAKPDAETLQRVPHFLVDIRDPAEIYSVAEFVRNVSQLITEIHARGNIPLLCGGTMLYFRAVTEGLSALPKANEAVRQSLIDEARKKGWHAMHAELRKIDSQAAAKIHPNDPQRIQRALEIFHITGFSMSEWLRRNRPKGLAYRFIKRMVVPRDRSVLHQRIEQRFDRMLKIGLTEEVEKLRSRGDLSLDKPSMKSVGYRQIWQYLDGDCSLGEARLKGIYATRQLAKRQLTWLRAVQGAECYDPLNSADTKRLISEFSANA